MSKFSKIGSITLLAVFVSVLQASAYISWFNLETNRIAYADGTTYLTGDNFSSSIGCFVQLVYAGDNASIDTAVNSGDGTTADDEVVATSWMGQGIFGGDDDGYVFTTPDVYDNTQRWYYVRAWTAPADDYGAGNVPSSTTNYYGNSPLWQNPASGDLTADEFNFGGSGDGNDVGWSTTSAVAIPEPSIVALAFIGLVTLRVFRRKKS